jgi:hypothetical protein
MWHPPCTVGRYADACRRRHAGNRNVRVHTACVGAVDGDTVTLSTAGPFTSAVEDEVKTVSASKLGGALQALGWGHQAAPSVASGAAAGAARSSASITATTVSLASFLQSAGVGQAGQPGAIDVLVIDVEARRRW